MCAHYSTGVITGADRGHVDIHGCTLLRDTEERGLNVLAGILHNPYTKRFLQTELESMRPFGNGAEQRRSPQVRGKGSASALKSTMKFHKSRLREIETGSAAACSAHTVC